MNVKKAAINGVEVETTPFFVTFQPLMTSFLFIFSPLFPRPYPIEDVLDDVAGGVRQKRK